MANPFNVRKEGSVASRFVSSSELSDAQKKREADLKAAYARIGQDAPATSTAATSEEYDPRSLFERLQANKDAKQEKFDETWKLSNQFRGIDEGESEFLAEVAREKAAENRRKREQEQDELEQFRRATQGRETSPATKSSTTAASTTATSLAGNEAQSKPAVSKTAQPKAGASAVSAKRKRVGNTLGVVRKKAAPAKAAATKDTTEPAPARASPTTKPQGADADADVASRRVPSTSS
ncbi:unnamed protein product [Parajaminaea phylloscopi]